MFISMFSVLLAKRMLMIIPACLSLAAFCDVATRLSCYDHALREAERYGNKWSQRWANEPTYLLVLKEIGAILLTSSTVVDECLYPSFELFLQDFLRHGMAFYIIDILIMNSLTCSPFFRSR